MDQSVTFFVYLLCLLQPAVGREMAVHTEQCAYGISSTGKC